MYGVAPPRRFYAYGTTDQITWMTNVRLRQREEDTWGYLVERGQRDWIVSFVDQTLKLTDAKDCKINVAIGEHFRSTAVLRAFCQRDVEIFLCIETQVVCDVESCKFGGVHPIEL